MSGAVQALKGLIPKRCHATKCNRHGCRVDLQDLPSNRIIVDVDCKDLGISDDQKRCDYLYVSETQVAPIELKSGKVSSASDVVEQLQKGADQANHWLPPSLQFEFVPILAHGEGIHREILNQLRSRNLQFRGRPKKIKLLRCGHQLKEAIG